MHIEDGSFWVSKGYRYIPGVLVETDGAKTNLSTEARGQTPDGGELYPRHDMDASYRTFHNEPLAANSTSHEQRNREPHLHDQGTSTEAS